MSVRRRKSGGWQSVSAIRRQTGSDWQNASTICRYTNNQWINIWQPTGTFTKRYSLSEYASYYIQSGTRRTDMPSHDGEPVLMQGSPNGSAASIVSTMMFFPIDSIRNDLADATLTSAAIRLSCVGSNAISLPRYILLHYGGGYSSCPDTWDGSDSGDADKGTPYTVTGYTDNYSLNHAVISGILDGSVTFLALNAASRPQGEYYMMFDAPSTELVLKYTRP